MTSETESLDPSPIASGSILLYRLARNKYANLTGVGAALYPGRWNLLGQEAIYTSANRSTTVLERLVHTPKDRIPANLALMQISLKGQWRRSGNRLIDETTKARIHLYCSLSEAKQSSGGVISTLEAGTRPLAVAVPSVVDAQWNLVLFPRAKDFDHHVTLEKLDAFEFDPRLFPEHAISDVR